MVRRINFFSRNPPNRPLSTSPITPQKWFQQNLARSGLAAKIPPEVCEKTQKTVRVYYNERYFAHQEDIAFSLRSALTKIPAVNISGDKEGYFQNGAEFPNKFNFSKVLPGDPELLSPAERLSAGKKIISSDSVVFAAGGYPLLNPLEEYKEPINVGLFSIAGASFENDYLHYSLFMMDQVNHTIKNERFAHLFNNMPVSFEQAKAILGNYDLNKSLTRIRTGFPLLARSSSGEFYSSFGKSNAVIFASEAYFKHQLEDISLLLTSVNEAAKQAGKPALLKATAVGMGFFAMIDRTYDIHGLLYPYYLRAYKKLLSEQSYPWIAKIEFPIFNEQDRDQFNTVFDKPVSIIETFQRYRDVLMFTAEEREKFYLAAINASDAFSYAGNEWCRASVESMIGSNSSLRFDQVCHANSLLLDPSHHIAVKINESDFSAELLESPINFRPKI